MVFMMKVLTRRCGLTAFDNDTTVAVHSIFWHTKALGILRHLCFRRFVTQGGIQCGTLGDANFERERFECTICTGNLCVEYESEWTSLQALTQFVFGARKDSFARQIQRTVFKAYSVRYLPMISWLVGKGSLANANEN